MIKLQSKIIAAIVIGCLCVGQCGLASVVYFWCNRTSERFDAIYQVLFGWEDIGFLRGRNGKMSQVEKIIYGFSFEFDYLFLVNIYIKEVKYTSLT